MTTLYLKANITAYNGMYVNEKNTNLGNILFQTSFVYAMSKKYNRCADFSLVYYFCKKLNTLGHLNYDHTIFRNLVNIIPVGINYPQSLVWGDSYNIPDDFINNIKNSTTNLEIGGYFEAYKFFDEYKSDILNIFSIDTNSLTYIKNKYNQLFDENTTCISLHIRNGTDILTTPCLHTRLLPLEYYYNSILYFEKISDTNNVYFIISDNLNNVYIKLFQSLNIKFVIIEKNPDYIDLWIQSLCKHNITSGSTFAWWGSYLNTNIDKKVLYPNIYKDNYIKSDNYFHESSIGI